MSRVARYKIGYVVALCVVAALAFGVVHALGREPEVLLAVGVALLVPGRVQGVVFRALFQGRRAFATGHAEVALKHFERFLGQLRAAPWRKRMLWLSWSVYTPDAEAMALNNVGSTLMVLGKFDEAARVFEEALAVDPLYPLPHFNMAIVEQVRGNSAAAARLAGESARLGYAHSTLDVVIHRAQALLATVEGRRAGEA
ncbi:tetratricopeptide repeat protein [Chondromyces crocatus]|uniref:tetratricopeptide repeat protein n=1 Tax=Chondromyces crocatus TaxID=52 RepID=UPI00067C1C84|nr:tetratricopeptide repeat protein [Chondromyces crocatus]